MCFIQLQLDFLNLTHSMGWVRSSRDHKQLHAACHLFWALTDLRWQRMDSSSLLRCFSFHQRKSLQLFSKHQVTFMTWYTSACCLTWTWMDGQDPVLVQLYYCWGAQHILYDSLPPLCYKRVLGVKKLLLVVGIFSLHASVCPACWGLLGQLSLPAQWPCIVLPVPLGQEKPAGRWWFCATHVWPEGVRWSGRVSLWSSVVHVAKLLL